MRALIAGGADLLLVETIFDSLNAKAALVAIREVFDQDGKKLPVMISAAVGRGGETWASLIFFLCLRFSPMRCSATSG